MKHLLLSVYLISSLLTFAQKSNAQTPTEIIQVGDKTIPVYDFANLEPMLKPTGDSIFVINFWATWCIPCVQELPYFEQLLEKYQSEKISVKLVSLDFKKQVDKSLIPFIKKKQLKSEVILLDDKDANSWIDNVDPSWSGALPATLILNSKQRLFFEKSFNFEELESEYLKLKKQ